MNQMSNLLQLANFPMPHGGGPMTPWQNGMFPPAFGGPQNMMGMLGDGMGGQMMPRQAPFGNGGYGNGMNNMMMMHQLNNGSGYGGY